MPPAIYVTVVRKEQGPDWDSQELQQPMQLFRL